MMYTNVLILTLAVACTFLEFTNADEKSVSSAPTIEHVVFLVMENRPYDFFFGFLNATGADGLTGEECNYFDPKDPSKGKSCVQPGKAKYVCQDAASMSYTVFEEDIFGESKDPNSKPAKAGEGYLWANNGNEEVMWQMNETQVPIKTFLAKEYAIFDKWHSSFPGPSTPNHLFLQTATSAGCTTTGATYHCNGSLFKQKTIYESLMENNKTWAYYYNDSAWNSFLNFFHTKEGQAGMKTYDDFYYAAETGTLPSFSWISPRQGTNTTTGDGSNDDHPCHDIALGERLLKDTYEALRAGAAWNKTLFLVTYDDTGGWYDHAMVPTGVPAPDDEPSCPDDAVFTWLGARTPTLLISPWVSKGKIIHKPNGPQPNSEYEHSSLPATLKEIFNLPSFLTKRDAWAGSFLGELTESEPRTDTPMHTPEAPVPMHKRAGSRIDDDDDDDDDDIVKQARRARHCSKLRSPSCPHPDKPHKKQRQRMQQFAKLNKVSCPNPDMMTKLEADEFIREQFHKFRTSFEEN